MRCYECHRDVNENAMSDLDQDEFDIVVGHYGLIHLTGPEDMFTPDGYVIICQQCVNTPLQNGS